MLETYRGIVKGNVVELPPDVQLPQGAEVIIVVGDLDQSREGLWWMRLAESTSAKDWDNEFDAAYDNWREIYGVKE